jgi:hypothetical protein
MVDKNFVKKANQELLLVSYNIKDLLNQMKNYSAPVIGKWISKDKV